LLKNMNRQLVHERNKQIHPKHSKKHNQKRMHPQTNIHSGVKNTPKTFTDCYKIFFWIFSLSFPSQGLQILLLHRLMHGKAA